MKETKRVPDWKRIGITAMSVVLIVSLSLVYLSNKQTREQKTVSEETNNIFMSSTNPYPKYTRNINKMDSPPYPPVVFRGTLTVDGNKYSNIKIHAVMETKDKNGNDLGKRIRNTVETEENGKYMIRVPENGYYPDYDGSTVHFIANGTVVGKLNNIEWGTIYEMDLHNDDSTSPSDNYKYVTQSELDNFRRSINNNLEGIKNSIDELSQGNSYSRNPVDNYGSGITAFVIAENPQPLTINRAALLSGDFSIPQVQANNAYPVWVAKNGESVDGTIELQFIPTMGSSSSGGGMDTMTMWMMSQMSGGGNMSQMLPYLMMQDGQMNQTMMLMMMQGGQSGSGFGFTQTYEINDGLAMMPIMDFGKMATGKIRIGNEEQSFFLQIGGVQGTRKTGGELDVSFELEPINDTLEKDKSSTIKALVNNEEPDTGRIRTYNGVNWSSWQNGSMTSVVPKKDSVNVEFEYNGETYSNTLYTEGYSRGRGSERGTNYLAIVVAIVVVIVALAYTLDYYDMVDVGDFLKRGKNKW